MSFFESKNGKFFEKCDICKSVISDSKEYLPHYTVTDNSKHVYFYCIRCQLKFGIQADYVRSK